MASSLAVPTAFCPAFAKPILKLAILSALLVAAIVVAPNLQAQQPSEPPAAPVPSQILSAKKVFITNATGDHDPRIAKYFGGPDGLYNQLYGVVKSGGRFELVTAPSDADLVFQATLGSHPIVPAYAGLRLSIFDPKSNVLLWTISEPIDPAILTKNARKNIANALERLMDDLKTLTPGK
jgi:hypothetical protein